MKKIFIVAPYFPPSALPPSQRVRLIVKHAKELGFFPCILTVQHKFREELEDPWMCELLGTDYETIEVNCFDQNKTRKIGVGDLGLRMLPFLFFSLWKETRRKKPDFILYPVPPWYILIVAPILKWLTGIKYGIDFIDPWVHEEEAKYRSTKQRISQWVARFLEKWVTSNASVIFSVSEGINNNLKKRHPVLATIPMIAIPYGAEKYDFEQIAQQNKSSTNTKSINTERVIRLRYIGALWKDCYPVLAGFMPVIRDLAVEYPLKVEFFGTSYAGEGLAKPQLGKWVEENKLQNFVTEQPLRIPYRKAVELTLEADILFLIGGMQPYYAASKLMSLIVSGKPFLAFVHGQSFPAQFLKKINYPYIVTYSEVEGDLPIQRQEYLLKCFKQLIAEKDIFIPVDLTHPLVLENTAYGMTKVFMDNIQKIL